MNRSVQITVVGNSEATPDQYSVSYETGKLLAELDCIVITGGRGGIMEAVAKGVKEKNGICVGILPSDQFDGNQYNTVTIPTGIGYARNSMNVLAADLVIAVGGGAGTLSELAFAWNYNKPVFCYDGVEGWAKNLIEKQLDKRREDLFQRFTTIEELRNKLIKQIAQLNYI